jgi:hypothetical protein
MGTRRLRGARPQALVFLGGHQQLVMAGAGRHRIDPGENALAGQLAAQPEPLAVLHRIE